MRLASQVGLATNWIQGQEHLDSSSKFFQQGQNLLERFERDLNIRNCKTSAIVGEKFAHEFYCLKYLDTSNFLDLLRRQGIRLCGKNRD